LLGPQRVVCVRVIRPTLSTARKMRGRVADVVLPDSNSGEVVQVAKTRLKGSAVSGMGGGVDGLACFSLGRFVCRFEEAEIMMDAPDSAFPTVVTGA
jgi:hypothetical protein